MLLTIFAAFLFGGTVFMFGLSAGTEKLADRLGADIIIVPAGYDPHVDSVILSGKPSASYLPDNAMDELRALNLEAIDKITPQVFMATMKASCCSYPVQIMGIDCESDFIVRSWLPSSQKITLNDGEVLLGHHNAGNVGDEIVFFGKSLKIAGRLERTGMGFDSGVFMNRKTIIDLAKSAESMTSQKLAENNNLVSVIMIKLKPGQDTAQIARNINKSLNSKGIYALFSKRFVGNISSGIVKVSCIMKAFLAVMWGVSVIVIILLCLLCGKRRVFMSVTTNIFGTIAGIILGGIIIMYGSGYFAEVLGLP
ncbi:MAG: ABC transporter permease [Synergistaceae bacterium]|nr:ABC transporter permease [Synergistaceae bacterium]